MYLLIAWRNIWRNPRRTLVILTAVIIGVWSMIFLGALMRGMIIDMLENGKSTLTGDLQIHKKGYRQDPSIENSMTRIAEIETALAGELSGKARHTPRIKVSAVVTNARHSAGITLVGIRPEAEKGLSFIGEPLVQGDPLLPDDDNGILVGKELLDTFETGIRKKLVVTSRDAGGEIASRAFRIKGVFRTSMSSVEKQFVFVSLEAAQRMLNLDKGISEIAIHTGSEDDVSAIAVKLKQVLPEADYEIQTWQELLPMLKGYLDLFNGFIFIWYLVIFAAMGFGIVNTTLMAVFERLREFGLLKALGMRPGRIILSVLTESSVLLAIGIIAGNILALITIMIMGHSGIDLTAFSEGTDYFGMSRIIYPSLNLSDMAAANLTVFILGIGVSLYPAVKAAGFTPVEAMRKP